MIVRDRVWLIDRFSTSLGSSLLSRRKFSRTRSNTTMVSLIEKPITDRMPASTVRSNSCWVNANQPQTTSTSAMVASTAAMANLNSKRIAI